MINRYLIRLNIIATLCLPLIVYSQDEKIPTYVNRIMLRYADHIVEGYIKREGNTPVKLREDCFYFWYKSNSIHQTQGAFDGNLLDGEYSDFDLNVNLIEKGQFKSGLKVGVWKAWYPSGYIKEIKAFQNGKLEGRCELYIDSGLLYQKATYKKGMLEGELYNYVADSIKIQRYKKGKLVIRKEKIKKVKSKADKVKHSNDPVEVPKMLLDESIIKN